MRLRLLRGFAAAVAASLALGLAGCSTTYQLGGLFQKDPADSVGATASIGSSTRSRGAASAQVDLAYAKAAAAEVLARGGKDVSQPWENPRTGARGTVTPIASAYAQDGVTCRNFLASYVRGDKESWFQGGACRKGKRWEVGDLRPLQRT